MKQKNQIFVSILILFFAINSIIAGDRYKLEWGSDGIIIGSGVATAVPAFLMNLNDEKLPENDILALNKNDINFLDKFASDFYSPEISDFSDILLWSSVFAPGFLLLSSDVRAEWLETGTMYAETMILAYGLPHLVKGLIPRYRPFTYNSDAPMSARTEADAGRSFFSGHTTIAFASAVFISKVYSDMYPNSEYRAYVWGASLLLAATVGTLRVLSGKHFPTDVLTGAVVGSALGWLIPELHRNKGSNTHLGLGVLGLNLRIMF
jgi:membrane-associated phospholipid phosphatase